MPAEYRALLEATIGHLEELKARGVKFISVSRQSLAELGPGRRKPLGSPAAAVRPVQGDTVRAEAATAQAPTTQPLDPGLATGSESPPRKAAATSPLGFVPATETAEELFARTDRKPPLSPEAKAAAFAELRGRALACQKCSHLVSSRKSVVFGVGSTSAELMFVGEAPGADEDQQGEPFVGRAGQLLTKVIETMGLRREDVYIGNILKCRPDTPGQPTGNRKPTAEEMQTCIPFLHEQIDLIQPKVIVALGGTAVEGLLGRVDGITRLRGQWRVYRGIPLMPTYHPSYVLRPPPLNKKREIWEDMLKVMEKLGMPVSDKQRKFFTKA